MAVCLSSNKNYTAIILAPLYSPGTPTQVPPLCTHFYDLEDTTLDIFLTSRRTVARVSQSFVPVYQVFLVLRGRRQQYSF